MEVVLSQRGEVLHEGHPRWNERAIQDLVARLKKIRRGDQPPAQTVLNRLNSWRGDFLPETVRWAFGEGGLLVAAWWPGEWDCCGGEEWILFPAAEVREDV